MDIRRRSMLTAGIATVLCASSRAGFAAQEHVRLVVPQAAGGAIDSVARLLGAAATELGRPVVVENLPGAIGIVAMRSVLQAPADGDTLIFGYSGMFGVAPSVASEGAVIDPVKAFTPASVVAAVPSVLVVRADFPAADLRGLLDMARGGARLEYATPGIGTSPHLAGELLKEQAGVSMLHVPYRGGARAIVDLLAGQVSCAILGLASAAVPLREGRLRVLGVSSAQRMQVLPDVPTFAQQGLSGFDMKHWFGVFAAAQTPRPVLQGLNGWLRGLTQRAATAEKMRELGMEPMDLDLDAGIAFVEHDVAELRRMSQRVGMPAQGR